MTTRTTVHIYTWQMDNLPTFLELPLDRELYKVKEISKCEKPPLRVLITEAGTKIARLLMYKICSGKVFGPDQPVILHLVNSKGCVNHKTTLLDLKECGFPAMAGSVVIAEPEKSYANVDIVVVIALLEEISGHNAYNSFLCHLNKIRNVARNVRKYAKPDTKLVVCSPSTKGCMVLLSCIRKFEPKINVKNVTGVVNMDETLTKNLVAAQLQTTTDKIKNVTIWGATSPDLHNSTVLMYPPEDKSNLEKVSVPVMEALKNQKWVYSDLIPSIFNRVASFELINHGGALASAIAKHLKSLYSPSQEEIISMGVIVPSSEPFGLKKDVGFSLPVQIVNGSVTVREDVDYSVTTHLMNLRTIYQYQNDSTIRNIYAMVNFIKDYEKTSKRNFQWIQHTYFGQNLHSMSPMLKYILSPTQGKTDPERKKIDSKKSITWGEDKDMRKSFEKKIKSILRFNLRETY